MSQTNQEKLLVEIRVEVKNIVQRLDKINGGFGIHETRIQKLELADAKKNTTCMEHAKDIATNRKTARMTLIGLPLLGLLITIYKFIGN